HFEGARGGETEGLIVRHVTRDELRRLLEAHGLEVLCVQPYGQDAELLPLPRRIRVPITDRVPVALKDRILDRAGHQLAAGARHFAAADASQWSGWTRRIVRRPGSRGKYAGWARRPSTNDESEKYASWGTWYASYSSPNSAGSSFSGTSRFG